MKGLFKKLGIFSTSLFIVGVAHAQTSNTGSLGGVTVFTGEEGNVPDWGFECIDPTNKTPYSPSYVTNEVGNELMFCCMGGGGTWTAGGSAGSTTTPPAPCFEPDTKVSTNAGKFAFSYGNYQNAGDRFTKEPPDGVASLQQYSPGFHDRDMALNYGAPTSPTYSYANFVIDNSTKPVYFGNTPNLFYAGQSNRYMTLTQDGIGGFNIDLQVELVADAARFRWTCTNTTTAVHTLQLWFCSGIEMLDYQDQLYWTPGSYAVGNFGSPYFDATFPSGAAYLGPDAAGEPPFSIGAVNGPAFAGADPNARLFREAVGAAYAPTGYQGIFVYLPNQRPPDTDIDFVNSAGNTSFPSYADFVFGETDPFGIRIETTPSTATADPNPTNTPTSATELTLGKSLFIIGDTTSNAQPVMTPTNLLPDTGFLDQPAFVIKYQPVQVAGNQTVQFLNYVRSTWGNANYALPFGAVVDAPAVVQEGPTNYDGTATAPFNPNANGTGGELISNPTATAAGVANAQLVRVWIDNVGGNVTNGYGVDNKEFELDDIEVNLAFPGNPGVKVVNTSGATQEILKVLPRTDGFVDFYVQFPQDAQGDIPYTVTINTVPINTKVINGSIQVSGRPQLTLYPGANLVAAPYVFTDSSWISILQDFENTGTTNVGSGATVNTYSWDATRQGYDLSLSASRGTAIWAVYSNPSNLPVFAAMEGSPTTPQGFDSSTQQVELKPGWNLVANPFDLEFPVSQINGVAASNPDTVYTYTQMVALGYIGGFVASWNPVSQAYVYTSASTGNLSANTGYWVDNLLSNDITIAYPPLFTEGSPNSFNRAPSPPLGPGLWRLSLSAAEGQGSDSAVVGTASSPSDAVINTIYKAPSSPTQTLLMGIYGTASGKTAYLTQALKINAGSYAWTGYVNSLQAGSVTVKWPNVASVPSQYGVFLLDTTSGQTVDMRVWSQYTYAQLTSGVRHFEVLVQPLSKSTTLIKSLTASTEKVGTTTDEKFTYVLSASATTTTLVRNAKTLAVVAEPHANRVDPAGTSIDLWNMKNTLGQTVPAGSYLVQVTAVTTSGVEQTAAITISVP